MAPSPPPAAMAESFLAGGLRHSCTVPSSVCGVNVPCLVGQKDLLSSYMVGGQPAVQNAWWVSLGGEGCRCREGL